MAFLDALIGDPRFRSTLRDRAGGQDTLASQVYGQARAANAGAAQGTAARAMDQGVNPALANRLAARQEGAANAAAGQTFAQQQTAERAQAEQQLAAMRQQRQAFLRNLLGAGAQTASSLVGTLGVGGPAQQQPQGAAGGLGAVGGLAGTAVGGPLGGMVGGALGNAVGGAVQPSAAAPAGASTMGLVDQALATPVPGGGVSVAAPASIPGGDAPQTGTNDEFLTWLLQNRGMR
jgi:hypothetical protein